MMSVHFYYLVSVFIVHAVLLSSQVIDIPPSYRQSNPASITHTVTASPRKVSVHQLHSYANLDKLLSSFTLVSHTDIIIVSDGTVSLKIEEINEALGRITAMKTRPRGNCSVNHLNEDIIYHISSASSGLFQQLSTTESKNAFDTSESDAILNQDYVKRGISSNAIYLIMSKLPIALENRPCEETLVKQGYISSLGNFAWFYVYSAHQSDIHFAETENGQMKKKIKKYPLITPDTAKNSVLIASLIAKLGESMNSLPTMDAAQTNTRPITSISIAHISICIDDILTSASCASYQSDNIVRKIVPGLTELLSFSNVKLIFYDIMVDSSQYDTAHAILRSLEQKDNTIFANSKIFIDWFSTSSSWKRILSQYAEVNPSEVFLPVISLLSSKKLILDNDASLISTVQNIEQHNDPWGVGKIIDGSLVYHEDALALSNRLAWPSRAVIVNNNKDLSISINVQCDRQGSGVFDLVHDFKLSDPNTLGRLVMQSILSATWLISPPMRYYSIVSGIIVHDENWHFAKSKSGIQFSTQEKRHLLRHIVMYRADSLIARFLSTVNTTDAIPGLNLSIILDYRLFLPSTVASSNRESKFRSDSKLAGYEHLSQLMSYLHEMSQSFAHQDYVSCLSHLNNAERVVEMFEQSYGHIVSKRIAKVTLPQDRLEDNAKQEGESTESSKDVSSDGSLFWKAIGFMISAAVGATAGMLTKIPMKKEKYLY